jgi:hypothetical protein
MLLGRETSSSFAADRASRQRAIAKRSLFVGPRHGAGAVRSQRRSPETGRACQALGACYAVGACYALGACSAAFFSWRSRHMTILRARRFLFFLL